MPIPTVTALPDPPTRGTDTGATFSTKAAAFNDALKDVFVGELNTFATDLVAATTGYYNATSTTSVAIGTGSKSFTIQTGKAFVAGDYMLIADSAAPTTNYMFGQVTSYNSGTGALVFDSQRVLGSGTITSWTVNLSGANGIAGDTLPSFSGNGSKFLQLDSGGSATQWTNLDYVQIAQITPSAVATASITGISTAYKDLYLVGNLSAATNTMRLELSPDGSSWSSTANIAASGASIFTMHIPRYNEDIGGIFHTNKDGLGASPSLSATNTSYVAFSWKCTGGIDSMRFTPATGTFTGTITLYGRL